jgi:tetratricopeptide (TPR) repeat protein
MNKIKSGVLLLAALFVSNFLRAQTIEDGKKFLYYERYKSAKGVFEKLVNADPNNLDAVYWLGQALIAPEEGNDIAGAKALYQKALMANSSSPLLLAGMGHIELIEGKTQDARNRFETAISLSQGKNAAVLNAIGFANVVAKNGDVNYAIDKLKQATTIKKMNDPDVFINLGDAYKKIGEGGPAQTAYESALALNPNYARASYRIGKIYQTQGIAQNEITMRYYNDAIAKDATYAPVYENLYQYLYTTNVGQSAEYLEKYLANTDDDP